MIEYRIGNDVKLRLAFIIGGQRVSPDLVPFDLRVWTLYPSQAKTASFDGANWVNCIKIDDYLEVNLNAPQFTSGRLNCDVTMHYPDNEMGDLAYDKIIAVRFDNPLVNPNVQGVIITGEISDTITGLDAYAIAVQEGFGGTRQQWLDSLKEASEDAAETANEAIAEFAAAEAARQSQEGTRQNQEAARQTAEGLRQTAEQGRSTAEGLRNSAELLRNSNEASRQEAFSLAQAARANAFDNAEELRQGSEVLRNSAELIRHNQEETRVSLENTRQTQETARQTAEGLRNTAETTRQNQETTRQNQETARQTAEGLRQTAETTRHNQETTRQTQETARQTAEGLRNTAETTRQNQETARQNTIAGLAAQFADKQSIIDETLETKNKTIPLAINEVNEVKIDKTSITDDFGDNGSKVISQKGFTDNISEILQLEGEELWAYGVKWNQDQSSPTLERIGNLNLHRKLPAHISRGCVVRDDGTINYYLHPSSDLLKEDGVTPSVLDGSDGDVMTHIKLYYRTAINDNTYVNWMSQYPLPGYTLYECYVGRYKASRNRITNRIHSVVNSSADYRGGNNNAAWDNDGRSLLGCAVSGINRATFRTSARANRNDEWNGALDHEDHFIKLLMFRVAYATHNVQLPYNPVLDSNGFRQGGLGNGVTNLNSDKWNGYNGYNSFIPCGYTAEFGDDCGVRNFTMPYEYDAFDTTTSVQMYGGVYSDGSPYTAGQYVADHNDAYKGSGDGTLYKCILDAPAGTSLENTTYFTPVTRTVTTDVRLFGMENVFGLIWEFYSNILIEHNADSEPKTSKAYIFKNSSQIAETRTGNEEYLCDLPITDGYIKEFNANSLLPKSVGGGSSTYGCDYYYAGYPASGIVLRGCLVGGNANDGSTAGLAYSDANASPSIAHASIGGRLCYKPRKQ